MNVFDIISYNTINDLHVTKFFTFSSMNDEIYHSVGIYRQQNFYINIMYFHLNYSSLELFNEYLTWQHLQKMINCKNILQRKTGS